MSPRLLSGIALALLALIALSRGGSAPAPVTPAAPVPPASPTAGPPGTPVVGRPPRVAPLPNAMQQAGEATREIDLLATLAVRRRIQREGTLVYLDSLLQQTDSTVVRWADRGGRPLTVAFVSDTSLEGWSPSFLAAARQGMESWRTNPAGIRFQEVPDPQTAEITVEFVASVSDSSEFGVTRLEWESGGTASRAGIRLALRPEADRPLIAPAVMRRVATHEFGHALGLPHSGSRNDIMHPSSPVSAPSRRDNATLQLLYSVPPGSLRTP